MRGAKCRLPVQRTSHLALRTSVPQYLAIGHLTVDRLVGGPAVGGSVAYAAITAQRLGMQAGIVTVAGRELDWQALLPDVQIHRLDAPATTSFENLYQNGGRSQRILAAAAPVPALAVPADWRGATIVHLAPVDHEVGDDLPGLFPDSLVGLTPQGLLRRWDRSGRVRQGRWAGNDALLAGAGIVVLSEEDLAADPGFLSLCRDRAPIVLLTRGSQGVVLFVRGDRLAELPAFPTREVDPTGAGDVFAAAFLVEYKRTRDPHRSAAFACCAASFAVERFGLEGIPDRKSVEHRLSLYAA